MSRASMSLCRMIRTIAATGVEAQKELDADYMRALALTANDRVLSSASRDTFLGRAVTPDPLVLREIEVSFAFEFRKNSFRRFQVGFGLSTPVSGIHLVGPGFEHQYGASEHVRQSIRLRIEQVSNPISEPASNPEE